MKKEEIFLVLKENVLKTIPDLDENRITIEESLKNLGANSIDRMDIIIGTMEDLQLNVPLVEFGKLKNIQEIVELFLEKKVAN